MIQGLFLGMIADQASKQSVVLRAMALGAGE